jgi:DNA-3-methyladenine glycosylase I
MAVGNARALLALHEAGETLAGLCEEAAAPARRARPTHGTHLLPTVPEAERLSKHLRRLGFRFVGPTVLYAFWQSAGFVDDHLDGCWVPPSGG